MGNTNSSRLPSRVVSHQPVLCDRTLWFASGLTEQLPAVCLAAKARHHPFRQRWQGGREEPSPASNVSVFRFMILVLFGDQCVCWTASGRESREFAATELQEQRAHAIQAISRNPSLMLRLVGLKAACGAAIRSTGASPRSCQADESGRKGRAHSLMNVLNR